MKKSILTIAVIGSLFASCSKKMWPQLVPRRRLWLEANFQYCSSVVLIFRRYNGCWANKGMLPFSDNMLTRAVEAIVFSWNDTDINYVFDRHY